MSLRCGFSARRYWRARVQETIGKHVSRQRRERKNAASANRTGFATQQKSPQMQAFLLAIQALNTSTLVIPAQARIQSNQGF